MLEKIINLINSILFLLVLLKKMLIIKGKIIIDKVAKINKIIVHDFSID